MAVRVASFRRRCAALCACAACLLTLRSPLQPDASFVISAPSNFRQTASVTTAVAPVRQPQSHGAERAPYPHAPPVHAARVFDVDSLPPEIVAIFEAAGLSRDDLRNPQMAEFAFKFVKQHLDALDGKAAPAAQPQPGARVAPPRAGVGHAARKTLAPF